MSWRNPCRMNWSRRQQQTPVEITDEIIQVYVRQKTSNVRHAQIRQRQTMFDFTVLLFEKTSADLSSLPDESFNSTRFSYIDNWNLASLHVELFIQTKNDLQTRTLGSVDTRRIARTSKSLNWTSNKFMYQQVTWEETWNWELAVFAKRWCKCVTGVCPHHFSKAWLQYARGMCFTFPDGVRQHTLSAVHFVATWTFAVRWSTNSRKKNTRGRRTVSLVQVS